jgi:hypothetical protein
LIYLNRKTSTNVPELRGFSELTATLGYAYQFSIKIKKKEAPKKEATQPK